jgi:hypothetical protein
MRYRARKSAHSGRLLTLTGRSSSSKMRDVKMKLVDTPSFGPGPKSMIPAPLALPSRSSDDTTDGQFTCRTCNRTICFSLTRRITKTALSKHFHIVHSFVRSAPAAARTI